jgi:heterodisulfide reductase subunit A2
MVSVGRHSNIKLFTNSDVDAVSGHVGNFVVKIKRKPRYIDETNCTGCGQCAEVCPIEIENPFDLGLSKRKAAYRNSAQSVPNAFAIEKQGIAPCRDACPTGQRAMGYIALIRQKRYADAYWAIRREHPFPSVCGRVCNHRCEDACSRGEYDEPVNVMGLKRFVSDWAYDHRDELSNLKDKSLAGTPFLKCPTTTNKKIAIIGAGPAGLTAGLDMVRIGHKVTVFDRLPMAGGMMRVGIPPHRLPYELLDWEVGQIIAEGVELRLNTNIDDIPGLLKQGFDAVIIATGAHVASKLNIPNANHNDNWLSLDLFKRVALGDEPDFQGKKVAVLGGGNVALDAARVAVRLGEPEVNMICLEPRGEMPGFDWEIQVAEEEGIELHPGRVFKEIVVKKDKVVGVRCARVIFRGFENGKPVIDEISDTGHIIPADLVVWAIGQKPDFEFLPHDGSIETIVSKGILTDDEMMTNCPGVFAAGDVNRGMTFFVVDAIAEGHKVARCVDRYLRGEEGLSEADALPVASVVGETIEARIAAGQVEASGRVAIPSIPVTERRNNFREVDLTMTEAEAISEAARCVQCGTCSECLECVVACERNAIDHEMQEKIEEHTVGAIVLATGFKDFDPGRAPEFGYGLPNVLTAMEFERLINPSGPTFGKVLMENGRPPKRVAILHCVGSRDDKYQENCSRVCCMYSLKIAQLVHDYMDSEVFEIYRDMRTFGKDYEEFFNRTGQKGVRFYHGNVKSVTQKNGQVTVRWDNNYFNEPDYVEVDMAILATGLEPQSDSAKVASVFGINLGPSGFFLERHPKLAPLEAATDGIFLAGACQGPKDIPDSVMQAGGAAGAALSLIDQDVVFLDPAIAKAEQSLCAGCGQCVKACPYEALQVVDGYANVDSYQCKGCGTCAGACPNKAMTLTHYDDRQLIAELLGALQ